VTDGVKYQGLLAMSEAEKSCLACKSRNMANINLNPGHLSDTDGPKWVTVGRYDGGPLWLALPGNRNAVTPKRQFWTARPENTGQEEGHPGFSHFCMTRAMCGMRATDGAHTADMRLMSPEL
jgi:hypothetical protein